MPSLPNWLSGATASAPVPGSSLTTSAYVPRAKDPNAPDNRLQIATKCIYERQLPGGSYITAHIERLQVGYYDSPGIHEDCIRNVRFVAIRFVFHEASTDRRFKSARITVSLNDQNARPQSLALPPQLDRPENHGPPPALPGQKPKFLRHAPHLLYGSISPETLDWNFNLAGSVGVSQAPVSASISPSGGLKSSYKVYKMMKIQGSIRSNTSWHGTNYDLEDGEIVWTLEENSLQKSGLPREFTFVMMLAKGDDTNHVRFDIDIEPEIATWFGHYPQWWVHILKYQPLFKEPLDLDQEIGQRFQPSAPTLGFNFAALMSTFDDFVSLPGTTYGGHDPFGAAYLPTPVSANNQPNQAQTPAPAMTQSPTTVDAGDKSLPSNTIHVRIHLDQPLRPSSLTTAGQSDTTTTRSQRTPPITSTPSPQPASKHKSTTKSSPTASTKAARRVTINGASNSNPPKLATSRARPLSTHDEEPRKSTEQSKSISEDDDVDGEFEYAFPEPMSYSKKPMSQSVPSLPKHRQTKSSSTASSSIDNASKVANGTPKFSNSTSKTPPSHHSLRRTRSRSGLRKASLHSEPEDEEAISAAMDMLSGSPPPPAPRPPASAPPAVTLPTDDMILATPRTRAALADLLEVEKAESARIERRNGNLNTQINKPSRDVSTDRTHASTYLTSRSHEREKLRQKRFSMPITSTGIGYPSNGTTGNTNNHDSGTGSGNESSGTARPNRSNSTTRNGVGVNGNSNGNGNGRSSLMIPVGAKRDPGFGIGVATSTPDIPNYTSTSAVRSESARRALEFNAGAVRYFD